MATSAMDPHVRYAALVARQLAAIRAEDLEEFNALARQRDAAAAEIERVPLQQIDEPARNALAEASELDAEILALLRSRRDHLRARLRAEESASAQARAYARAAAPASARTFDVSL